MEQFMLPVFVTGMVSSLFSTVAGHGGALLLLPVLGFYLPPKEVIGIVMLYYFSMNIIRISAFNTHIRFDVFFWLTVGSSIAIVPGVMCIRAISPFAVYWIILTLLAFYFISEIFRKSHSALFLPDKLAAKHKLILTFTGIPYGFLSGLISSGSIIRTPVLLRMGLLKEQFISTTSLSSIWVNSVKMYFYIDFGFLNSKNMGLSLLLALSALTGTIIGKRILPYMDALAFKRFAQVALFFSAVGMVVKIWQN